MKLDEQWENRLKLKAEGNKLWAEADKLRAKADKLWAESNKLRAKADKLWVKEIIKCYSDITIKWIWRPNKQSNACKLENGDIYEP